MGPEEQALLEQLKDVALPADPGWWPLAIGWWIAIIAALIVCGVAYFLINRVLKKREQDTWRTMALIEHQRISDEFSTGKNRNKTLAELSVLMRRVALAVWQSVVSPSVPKRIANRRRCSVRPVRADKKYR